MENELGSFIEEIRGLVEEEIKGAYGRRVYERWLDPIYMGSIEDPDGYARLSGSCDDTMEIFLKFDGERVREAAFRTNGCGTSLVCGSYAAEMAKGKRSAELLAVTGEAILEAMGGLPQEEAHCAHLAGQALQGAVRDFLTKRGGKDGD